MTIKPKRRNARRTARDRPSAAAGLNKTVAMHTRERDEALEQQAATAEVLKVISRSHFDLQGVLDKLTESAARLCEAEMAGITREHGGAYYYASVYNYPSELHEFIRNVRHERTRGSVTGRALLDGKTIHVPDVTRDLNYTMREFAEKAGFRTVLGVPLLREGAAIGVIVLTRSQVRPFNEKQIELVTTFADQAVIAIENTRLLNELRQRTTDLSESLQQQTATADVLKVISRSTFDLQTVLNTLVESAMHLCEAEAATIWRPDGDVFKLTAHCGFSREFEEFARQNPITPGRGTITGRTALEGKIVHVSDVLADPKLRAEYQSLGNYRSALGVPLLRGGETIGVFVLTRSDVRPYTEKQIELVTTFVDQAVIAIENVRLFEAERQRTRELTESLEQQTATSEVLSVISSSPGELEPVFETMLENAVRISGAKFGNLFLREGDSFRIGATTRSAPPAYVDYLRRERVFRADPRVGLGRLLRTKLPYQVADTRLEPTYKEELRLATIELAGARTLIGVPMLKDGEVNGCIVIYRQDVRPFTDKQTALVQNFANQAVIAIENVRLLNELRESLQQQTATAEVLKVISRSAFDLRTVLDTLLQSAARLCDAEQGTITQRKGNTFYRSVSYGFPPAFAEYVKDRPVELGRDTGTGRALLEGKVIHIPDVHADPDYKWNEAQRLGGFRTMLGVPMLREGIPVGVLTLTRTEVRSFTDKQIELVATFADQAAIAIENVRLFDELQKRTDDLSEALAQQTAASEVLGVIASSTGELQPVFETLLANATRLCEASYGAMWLWEKGGMRTAALHGSLPAAYLEQWRAGTVFQPSPNIPGVRAITTRRPVHVADLREEQAYLSGDPLLIGAADVAGIRTLVAVPMFKDNEPVGNITIYRREIRPFTEKQIELVQNFAAQAVIAIENTRLLNELRQRTTDLTESLEQQTATANVLEVISRSAFDLQAVFETVVESSARLCGADRAFIFRFDGELLRAAAAYNATPEFMAWVAQHPIRPGRHSAAARAALERRTIHIADALADPEYSYGLGAKGVEAFRTLLGVPILKGDDLLGTLVIYHVEVRPFTDKQIALVETFADQAAIAIENVRLFEAEQQRTRELTESLRQQTATSEVLQVISSSPGDLEPVFASMLENAVHICSATFGNIYRWDGDALHLVATLNTPPALAEARKRRSLDHSDPETHVGRMVGTKTVVHVHDAAAEKPYIQREPDDVAAVELGEIRTCLLVPMLKENELIGSLTIYRQEVRPFTDKQIELVKSFASQAVIAIENTRLLTELRQRTDELARSVGELRALGEVSQAVNSTLELEAVLSTIVSKAVQLSGTEAGAIYVFDSLKSEFHLRATYGMDQALIDALTQRHIGLDDPNVTLALAQHEPVQIADLKEQAPSAVNEIILRAGYCALLVAPLLRGEEIVGMLVVRRRTPGAFPLNTVDLLKTFAAQSAVAIENARLFQSVEASLEDLRTAQDRLVQTEKLASLGQLTAGIAHEIKNPLNFVNNFSAISVELIDELREVLGGAHLDSKLHAAINEIADMLQGNLDKVIQHGKRADSIVKNMLLHSRQGSGEHRPVDLNALVDESLNLAYHGARAEKQGFNVTLERSFDPAAGEVDLFPQEITRVLLNLISNGFYAATKRKAEADGGDYEPTLAAATRNLGDSVEIRIRDNGTGIPPEVREKLFNPFFTTKPAGEGTGLGLSISHDIIVKQHGGSIEVDTQPGEFTEFRIVLPRGAATIAKSGERP